MCWRDFERPSDRLADFRRDQARLRLQQHRAYVGCEVVIDSYLENRKHRRYYRRSYIKFFGGLPSDTTEILLLEGDAVKFSNLPDKVRQKYELRVAEPEAKVIEREGRIGFAFGEGEEMEYFPLEEEQYPKFVVTALHGQVLIVDD